LDFDRAAGPFNSSLRPLGALKLTIQKYYRISGGTTQLDGVQSDIILPHPYENFSFGEREMEFPLPVDKVLPVAYDSISNRNFEKVILKSQNRISTNSEFKQIKAYSSWLDTQKTQTNIPLSYRDYFEREQNLNKEIKKYSDVLESENQLKIDWVDKDFRENLDSLDIMKYEKWFKSLSRDIYLAEGIRVVNDIENT
jgi:carboxyl-terminal processing protease